MVPLLPVSTLLLVLGWLAPWSRALTKGKMYHSRQSWAAAVRALYSLDVRAAGSQAKTEPKQDQASQAF